MAADSSQCCLPWSSPCRSVVKRAVRVPVIGVGKLWDGGLASKIVGDGEADMVAIGRQMIADPLSTRKILAGSDDEIVACRECLTCFSCVPKAAPLICSTNKNLTGEPAYR